MWEWSEVQCTLDTTRKSAWKQCFIQYKKYRTSALSNVANKGWKSVNVLQTRSKTGSFHAVHVRASLLATADVSDSKWWSRIDPRISSIKSASCMLDTKENNCCEGEGAGKLPRTSATSWRISGRFLTRAVSVQCLMWVIIHVILYTWYGSIPIGRKLIKRVHDECGQNKCWSQEWWSHNVIHILINPDDICWATERLLLAYALAFFSPDWQIISSIIKSTDVSAPNVFRINPPPFLYPDPHQCGFI